MKVNIIISINTVIVNSTNQERTNETTSQSTVLRASRKSEE